MPVFTFEKIPPPLSGATPAASEKPRGVIVQILDRLIGVRVRSEAEDGGEIAHQQKPLR